MALEATLDAAVQAGRAELTFSVVNAGTEPVVLRFDGDAAAEIAVFDGDDRVWDWADRRPGADAGRPLDDQRLAPGDTVVHRATWDGPPAGDYQAEARVRASNVERAARTTFSV